VTSSAVAFVVGVLLVAYFVLIGCFMVAVETRRFTTRGLLIATTSAAIMTGMLALLLRSRM
jgi:hypothetical protein